MIDHSSNSQKISKQNEAKLIAICLSWIMI